MHSGNIQIGTDLCNGGSVQNGFPVVPLQNIQYIQNYAKISTKQVIKLFELFLQNELTHTYLKYIYWAKVLPEKWELIQIFRKHEIFRKILRMHLQQAIIHLSKSLNFILIKCLKIT